MTAPWARVEPLADHHDTRSFDSGRESVDVWFRGRAWSSRNLVRTHVCLSEHDAVVAFFALKTAVFNASGLPSSLRSGANQDGNVAAVMLTQMGVRRVDQGKGHGAALFWEAVAKARAADAASRVPVFVVDAADEGLVGFYERLGMKRVPNSYRLAALIGRLPRGG